MQAVRGLGRRDSSGFYPPMAQADNPLASLLIRSQGAPRNGSICPTLT